LPEEIDPQFTTHEINTRIRALEVVSDEEVWFAGSGSMFGYTEDCGEHWTIDSINIERQTLEFRSIAVLDSAVFLLNAGAPAYLLRSIDKGSSWNVVYEEHQPGIFYNSMKFWDDQDGIAVGDPLDSCLSIIITSDGGSSWRKLDCSKLPTTYEGEAGFAASNTCIALSGNNVWLATGGKKARVFHSSDRGNNWEVADTPMQQGGKMTGIFSIDFYDDKQGIIFGGNWEDQADNQANKALSDDGGITWSLLDDGKDPGYRSCVQFIPNTEANGIFAVGIPGISYSADGGHNWQHFQQQNFYTIRTAKSGNTAWLAGKGKIAKMTW
jgi:photosystem II stability/assembly factor-like uncharacterized protein